MAPTTSRPWPPPSTADRARRSVGERLPRLSTPCCDPVRLVLRRPIESGLDPSVAVMDQAGPRPPALQGHDQRVDAQPGPEVVGHRPADDLEVSGDRPSLAPGLGRGGAVLRAPSSWREAGCAAVGSRLPGRHDTAAQALLRRPPVPAGG